MSEPNKNKTKKEKYSPRYKINVSNNTEQKSNKYKSTPNTAGELTDVTLQIDVCGLLRRLSGSRAACGMQKAAVDT